MSPERGLVLLGAAPLGFRLYAAEREVKEFLERKGANKGVKVDLVDLPRDKRALREVLQEKDIRGVFNLARERASSVDDVNYIMRRLSLHR